MSSPLGQLRRSANQSVPTSHRRDSRVAGGLYQCLSTFYEREVCSTVGPFGHSEEPAGALRVHAVPEGGGGDKSAPVLSLHR